MNTDISVLLKNSLLTAPSNELPLDKITELLSKKGVLSVSGGVLAQATWKERVIRFFNKEYDQFAIARVYAFVMEKLKATSGREREGVRLADAFVTCYKSNSRARELAYICDREAARYREEAVWLHPKSLKGAEKWVNYGFSKEIYKKYPEFCTFLEESKLLSQMKVTKDQPQEIDGEPAICVEGTLTKWSEISKRFEVTYSSRYKELFVVDRETSEVYTYLDNGKGLQKHHPYLTENTPLTILDEEELASVVAKGQEFIRKGEAHLPKEERKALNQKRSFVIQIVTSYFPGCSTNFSELITRPHHPYLRLIIGEENQKEKTKKGEVYEVGFMGWRNSLSQHCTGSNGQFRNPDKWEYVPALERVVTNIAVTQEEAKQFANYTRKYHRQGTHIGNNIGFHFMRQNCTTYVRFALAAAKIDVDTELHGDQLLEKITPSWALWIGKGGAFLMKGIAETGKKVVSLLPSAPSSVQDRYDAMKEQLFRIAGKVKDVVSSFFDRVLGLFLVPADAAVGTVYGGQGLAFVDFSKTKGVTQLPSRQWFKLSTYTINLPGVLQQWQRKQASTVVYEKRVRLAVIP